MAADSGIKARRSARLAEIEPPIYSSMTSKAMRSKAKKLDLSAASKDLSDALIHARLCDETGFIDGSARGPASPEDLAAIAATYGAIPGMVEDIASGSGGLGSP